MVDQGAVAELCARHGAGSLGAVFETLVGVPAAKHARLSFYGEPDVSERKTA